jgi:hypothetical protein
VDGDRDFERRALEEDDDQVDSTLHIARSGSRTLVEYVLVAAIFLGSLLMWVGVPAGWLWLVTRVIEHYPEAYAAALFGCPITMGMLALLLARLNLLYLRMSGHHPGHERTAWLKSLSGDRRARRPRTVLDTSMTISVVLAFLTLCVWYFLYAHSYMPGLPAP